MPFREPIFTGSTANQQQVISGQGGAQQYQPAVQTASVQANDLPAPGGASSVSYAPAPVASAPAPYTPPSSSAAPDRPATLGAPPTTLGQQAQSIDGGGGSGGGRHTVQPGDTMWNVSQRYHVPVEQMMAANGGTANIRIGQNLVIPGGGGAAAPAPAPVQVASLSQDVPVAPAAGTLTPPTAPVATAAEILPTPAATQDVALATPTGDPAADPPAAAPQQATAESFRWPVRGRVIAGFGRRPDGERNDGINLSVPEGTEVRAAEDGMVIYAGNELKSYGNLVLIRHANGWVSAYAHNSKLEVNRGDQVQRGQVVALSGMSGGVTTPQVHFELRHDATPVDPLQHLSEG